jgi:hypothetical protein
MMELLTIEGKTAAAVGHESPLALGDANGLTEIGFGIKTIFAFTTFKGI